MIVKSKVTRTDIVPTDILCNKCGKSLRRWCMGNENGTRGLLVSAYDSPVLPDVNLILEFALCEPCVIEISKDFIIPFWDENEDCAWTAEKGHRSLLNE